MKHSVQSFWHFLHSFLLCGCCDDVFKTCLRHQTIRVVSLSKATALWWPEDNSSWQLRSRVAPSQRSIGRASHCFIFFDVLFKKLPSSNMNLLSLKIDNMLSIVINFRYWMLSIFLSITIDNKKLRGVFKFLKMTKRIFQNFWIHKISFILNWSHARAS